MFTLGVIESSASVKPSNEKPLETDVDALAPSLLSQEGVETNVDSSETSLGSKVETDVDAAEPQPSKEAEVPADLNSKFADVLPSFPQYSGDKLSGNEALQGEFAESYTGVWLTYDYHDVVPLPCDDTLPLSGATPTLSRDVEECVQLLRLGEVAIALSPDVVHRLELFLRRFMDSLKITPSKSTGQKERELPWDKEHSLIQSEGV